MSFYVMLSCCVLLVVYLACLVWIKTRNPAYIFGMFCMYYWSLHGSWTIIGDNVGISEETKHQYLYDDLFFIECNASYAWSILFYTAFIVTVQLTVLFTSRKGGNLFGAPNPIVISHGWLLSGAAFCGICALFIVRNAVREAADANVSAYVLTRSEAIPMYSLYTLLNRGSLIPAAIGLAILASGNQARFIVAKRCLGDWVAYLGILGVMIASCVALGNKAEVFMSFISAYLFYLVNTVKPRVILLHAGLAAGLAGFVLMDVVRAVPLRDLTRDLSWFRAEDFLRAAKSNEVFGAHFSMYGAVNYDIPKTYGSSIVSFMCSVIPRAFWADRPDGIYVHYATSLGFNSLKAQGQGYSVHHATGWYLNFGLLGILAGAMLLARIWTWLFNCLEQVGRQFNSWIDVFIRICPWVFTAAIPSLLRTGPEGYKGAILEAFIIPVMVFGWARLPMRSPCRAEDNLSPRSLWTTQPHAASIPNRLRGVSGAGHTRAA